ncbi:MAG: outer membrane protein assembly factor BamA [Verrucomicrobiota bacterium]|nr:outer membrane protein assembly factor BamA [Verrucomicrobiota bacterium]
MYWFFLSFLFASLAAPLSLKSAEFYEERKVGRIEIVVEAGGDTCVDSAPILARLKTHTGDFFSQQIFDNDLKALSEEYDRVEPSVRLQEGEVCIEIHIWPRPVIHEIVWEGNDHIKTSKLQEELGIGSKTRLNRQEFNKAFNKVKEYYFKKGYFESQLCYSIVPLEGGSEVDIVIQVQEGEPGCIQEVRFSGFSEKEESALREQMYLKKYNFLTSWVTGSGIYREELLEQDRVTLIQFLQNEGYADAQVEIVRSEDPNTGRLIIEISADKGALYSFGEVHFEGNHLIETGDLQKKLLFSSGAHFSPEQVRETTQAIKDLYGQKGYIDASVQVETSLKEDEHVFNVEYVIEEGDQYKIGLIHIFGNTATESNVILRESLLVPGEVFDVRKVKATQQRLEAVGYFKSVNVYAVRSTEEEIGTNYRDVYIEVEETSTGNVSLFAGMNSTDSGFGGLELTERNFKISGIGKAFAGKISALRGGGEYFHVRGTFGTEQQNILVSWMDPYVNDTPWRLGVELTETFSILQKKVNVETYGGTVHASYPLSTYWTTGVRQRFRKTQDELKLHPYDDSDVAKASLNAQKEIIDQNGLVSALSWNAGYDSTDSAVRPHRGWRSYIETEVVGVGGKYQFGKASYLNAIYFPLSQKGTLKLRADFKYMIPFGKTNRDDVPYSERCMLGGEATVRGYQPFQVGPMVHLRDWTGNNHATHTPKGGLSSTLLSIEYNYALMRMLSLFTFVDAGSVDFNSFAIKHFQPTTGFGARLDLGNRAPIMVGWGIPLIRQDRHNHKWQRVIFTMSGQF